MVGFRPRQPLGDLLRRAVGKLARHVGVGGESAELLQDPRYPEVGHPSVARGVDQHVGGRQARMDDAEAVRRIEGVRDLPDDPQAHGRSHGLAGAQQLREGPPLDVLHGAPEEAVGGAGAVPRYDVRVIERRHEGRGPMERLLDLRPGSRSARHQFQRDRLIELQVPGKPHEGRGPAPV